MKILAISPGYIPIPSGAEISLHQTLKFLSENNILCQLLTIFDNPTLTDFFKVPEIDIIDSVKIKRVKRNEFINELEEIIYDFDIVILQMTKRFESLGIKNIEEFLNSKNIKWLYMQRDDPVKDLSTSKYIICNSKYSQEEYIRLTKINKKNTFVLTPPMQGWEYSEAKGKYITIINPILRKGGELLKYLAQEFPNEQFLAQLGWGVPVNGLSDYPNIHINQPVINMKEIYKKTDILLVPSIYEAFGRVSLEGALSGCIVLSSYVGGLKEINLPHECFIKEIDLKLWKKKLNSILSLNNTDKLSLRRRIYNRVKHYSSDLKNLPVFIRKISKN